MAKFDFEKMPLDELWALHEEICEVLSTMILSEKKQLEERLAQLTGEQIGPLARQGEAANEKPRKKYPRVLPKYQNPLEPSQTWSGRGKQPRWLVHALQSGKSIDEFRISSGKMPTKTAHP